MSIINVMNIETPSFFDEANFTEELKNFSTDELKKVYDKLKSELGKMTYDPTLITKILIVENELEQRWQD